MPLRPTLGLQIQFVLELSSALKRFQKMIETLAAKIYLNLFP